MRSVRSWGRYPPADQLARDVAWPQDIPAALAEANRLYKAGTLAFGMGRSYGDSCLAASGQVLATPAMDRVLSFDHGTGVLHAQAGMTLEAVLRLAIPHGWFLPVTPGTKFVSLGGAVANDVHGKNHHVMGTFGRHLRRFTLYRSDRGPIECSPIQESGLFAATIGGLGLTGILLTVELQLRRIHSSRMRQRVVKFGNLGDFFALSTQHDADHEYTVAWIDCLATGGATGRGLYTFGDHTQEGPLEPAAGKVRSMPLDPPVSLVNALSVRAFNALYYGRQRQRERSGLVDYDPFFYPLDALLHWNRIYGRKGFQQYQCVIPQGVAFEVLTSVLREIARSRTGSFLAVLKQCGDLPSPGLLSFPLKGVSLALDFAQRDEANARLFANLDALVHDAGGRLYPAKDAHMSPADFQRAYPAWQQLEALRDPLLLSRFWARITHS